MDAEQLTIKKTTFDGMPRDDDWLVIWRGLVGRSHSQTAWRDLGRAQLYLGHPFKAHLRLLRRGTLFEALLCLKTSGGLSPLTRSGPTANALQPCRRAA